MYEPKQIDAHVGAKLKMLRQQQGWTQKQLGAKVGLTFQQIQKYEKGLNAISSGRLYQFAMVLDVPPNAFFPSGETMGETVEASHLAVSLMRHFATIPDAGNRHLVIQVAKSYSVFDGSNTE